MSNVSELSSQFASRTKKRIMFSCAAVLVILSGIALNTKVVKMGSTEDVREQVFSAESYGVSIFPEIQKSVVAQAVDALMLADLLRTNSQQAVEKYGVGSPLAVFAVYFTGVVGDGNMGVYNLKIKGLPDKMQVRIQTGPAITGTALRDATGKIQFGDFKNQIEYQNAGSAINSAMKSSVLEALDTAALTGKTVKVVGVFSLLNPDNWLVTPVRIDIQ